MTINYTIEAKPTTYDGVNFRSRLEARWACFFDSYEYKWVYEPIDFGGWSPDFLMHWGEFPEYVEVKPIISFDKDTADKMYKYFNGGGGSGMLLCGLTPDYCWINWRGWWDEFSFSDSSSHWKSAGNVVQWHHS